jgi:hypothetical protein
MMTDRSSRADVRNPLLTLPAAHRLRALPRPAREGLRDVLMDLSRDARVRAQACWKSHKAPMALYWKVVSVYSRHAARLLK